MAGTNSERILEYFSRRLEASVSELADFFGVHKSTLAGILSKLEAERVVSRSGVTSSTGGRPSHKYRLRVPNPVAAFEFDGTQIACAVFDEGLEVLGKAVFKPDVVESPAQIACEAGGVFRKLCSDTGTDMACLAGAAVAINAVQVGGRIIVSSVLPWAGGDLESVFAEKLGVKVRIIASPRLLAEFQKLDPPLPRSMISFGVADGMSAHMVVNGLHYHGAFQMAGELGHVALSSEGPLCGCGRRGCLEAYCSGPAVKRRLMEDLEMGVLSSLSREHIAGLSARECVEELWSAWKAGDNYARSCMEDVLERLAWGLGLVVNIHDPETLMFSGYMLSGKKDWINEITRRSEKWILRPSSRPTRYVESRVTVEDYLRVTAAAFFHRIDKQYAY